MDYIQLFFPLAEAISRLLDPYGEIVIHNLETGKIAAIYNNFSKRVVGDESLLDELKDQVKMPDLFPIYMKTSWNGKKLKSTTATIRDIKGNPVGLFCINLDISKWEEFRHFLDKLIVISPNFSQPEILFKDDWREKINIFVSDYLKKEGTTFKLLSKEKKQDLIKILHKEGAFKTKNAAVYIANILGLSRATIYNYLRKSNEDT